MTLTGVLKHIHALEGAELVTTYKVGRSRYCRLRRDGFDAASGWMASRTELWSARLDRFQTHLGDHGGAAVDGGS